MWSLMYPHDGQVAIYYLASCSSILAREVSSNRRCNSDSGYTSGTVDRKQRVVVRAFRVSISYVPNHKILNETEESSRKLAQQASEEAGQASVVPKRDDLRDTGGKHGCDQNFPYGASSGWWVSYSMTLHEFTYEIHWYIFSSHVGSSVR